jgi:YVTN family beta-propeller protein
MKAVANIPVGIHPWGVALNSDGTEAYVANYNENTISIINLKEKKEIYRLPTDKFPTRLVYVP